MSSKTIWCMATSPEDEPIPLFVGREDGTVEKYISIADADLGRPSLIMRGHKKAVTGMSAVTSDEIYTCSLDGTVKQWNAEMEFDGRRILRSVDTKTPLRCLRMNDGRVFVGGENGSFYVIDNDRKSVFSGHQGAVTAIAVTLEGYVVTGGEDNQIRVWDITLGKAIRLLVGHQNMIKCLVVVEDEDADDARGAILSFSRDRTMKVWLVPNAQDAQVEEEVVDEDKKSFMVSFQEPGNESEDDDGAKGENDGGDGESPAAAAAAAAAAEDAAAAATQEGEAARESLAEEEDLQRRLSDNSVPIKSALKTKEKQLIRRDEALSTIELPEAPHCTFQEEESTTVYIGATSGYVYGIQAKSIAATVLKFVAKNKAMVRKDVRGMKQTVKKSIALYKKECRKAIKNEEKKHLRVARRNLKEKKKKEREERKKAREEKAAERAAKKAQREADDEEDEEEDEENNDEEEEEEDEEENNEEEEEEEDRLKMLSDEQREELKKFVAEREKERDEKIEALEKAYSAHLAKIEPLAKSTYDRSREEFHRLHWTTYTKVGKEGTLALTAVNGKVYAAQADRVVPTTVTKGMTILQ
eukprot:gene3989-2844_t